MTRNSAGQVSHISPCRTAPVVCESASSSSPISGHTIRVMVSVIVASCLPQCWAIDCCPKPLILLPLLIDLETGRIHAVTHARGSKSALRRGRWLFGQKYLTCFSSIWILSSWQATVSRSCKISPSCQILRQCDVPIRSWFVLLIVTCETSLLALQHPPESPFLQLSTSCSPLTFPQLIRLVFGKLRVDMVDVFQHAVLHSFFMRI